jgi:hypothetical protein
MNNKIQPTYVSFEQSKLLKEKGFDVITNKLYHYNGSDFITLITKNSENFGFSAPEQWQVVEWLRVNHGIWIQPIYQINSYWGFDIQKLDLKNILNGSTQTHIGKYNSPQEAYSAAFDYILNNNLI